METHRETLSWPVWLHIALGVVVILSLYGGIKLLATSWQGWVPLGLGVLLGLGWWWIRILVVETGPAGLAFGFNRPGRRVPRDRIRSIEAADYSALRYMGWGFRIGWRPGERAYSILGYRRGLQVSYVDEQDRVWHVFVSCSDPDAALRALQA